MSWRAGTSLGSLDGIEFDYFGYTPSSGQRSNVTDMPLRDDPSVQEMGRRQRTGSIDCLMTGEDFLVRTAKMEATIEKGGIKTLVHPHRGKMQVHITNAFEPAYSTEKGGMVRFTLQYLRVESTIKAGSLDTLGPLQNSVSGARSALSSALDAGMTVQGFPDFVQDAVTALLAGPRGVTSAMRQAYGKASATIGVLDDIAYAIESFERELDDLLGLPGELAAKLQHVMRQVMSLVTSKGSRVTTIPGVSSTSLASSVGLSQLDTMLAVAGPVITSSTPSRRRQAANQSAIEATARGSAAVEMTATLAAAPAGVLVSRARASEVGAQLVEALTSVAEEAADDGLYLALKTLAAAAHKHFNAVSLSLPVTTSYTPTGAVPALVLAHRLYGDATRHEDIINRNTIAHPGFIPGGDPIEVLHV